MSEPFASEAITKSTIGGSAAARSVSKPSVSKTGARDRLHIDGMVCAGYVLVQDVYLVVVEQGKQCSEVNHGPLPRIGGHT